MWSHEVLMHGGGIAQRALLGVHLLVQVLLHASTSPSPVMRRKPLSTDDRDTHRNHDISSRHASHQHRLYLTDVLFAQAPGA